MAITNHTHNVLGEVAGERVRQDDKWGVQNWQPVEWIAILGEEYGEACRGAFEQHFHGGSLANYREELLQVAAVAVAMVESLDRNGEPPGWVRKQA
jgi:hypothetical protein